MFALRILGLTYAQIAEKTGYKEDTVKHLFAAAGVLGKLWKEWTEKAKGESVEESLNMMFGHLPDIVRANILDAKMTNTPGAVAARKIIFDYTLGEPEKRVKLDAKIGIYTFADWIKAETLKDQENGQDILSEKSN
jgi:hypothetical protein